jgi:DNA-binding IclR family transcriptional regulator
MPDLFSDDGGGRLTERDGSCIIFENNISNMKIKNKNQMAPALARGLKVLEVLAEEESELTLRNLSDRLAIPTPSLWRILSVLRENGYVLLDQDRKTYRLGFKFLYLGNVLLQGMGFRSPARRFLRRLVALSGETAELSARVKDQLILIDQMEGPEAVRLFSRVGSAYPYFHATAPGKVYLAHMPAEKLRNVMGQMGLPRITEFTVSTFEDLEREATQVRKQGYAFDNQEMRLGVFRIAAPVYDQRASVTACLGIAGPSFRIDEKKVEKIGNWVRKLAREMSKDLKRNNTPGW